jgi:hypothetical protein
VDDDDYIDVDYDGDEDDNTNIDKTSNVNDPNFNFMCKNFEYTSSYFGNIFLIFLRTLKQAANDSLQTITSAPPRASHKMVAGNTNQQYMLHTVVTCVTAQLKSGSKERVDQYLQSHLYVQSMILNQAKYNLVINWNYCY